MNQQSTYRFDPMLWFAAALTLLASACGGATESRTDPDEGLGSETNWLSSCTDDSDCNVGACHCGVCTRTCKDDESCAAVGQSSCISPELLGDCEVVPARPICATEAALGRANEDFSLGEPEVRRDGGVPEVEDAGGDPPQGDAGPAAPGSEMPSEGEPQPAGSAPPDSMETLQEVSPVEDDPRADPSKVDLLLVVDNSIGMLDKQLLLEQHILEFTRQLVEPPCLGLDGSAVTVDPSEDCPAGTSRSHVAVEDLHVGTITTSLGGYGSELDCVSAAEGETDNAHLLGSIVESAGEGGFYRYCSEARAASGECEVADDALMNPADISVAGQTGCGWEASLETWYRFLVEPSPWTRIERQNCPGGGDSNMLCNGPELAEDGTPLVDTELLAQRDAFLRPDSTLVVLLLTDENDCSFRAEGQTWRLAQSFRLDSSGNSVPSRAYKGAEVCATSPDSPCCVSCGAPAPAGCPSFENGNGELVSLGCEVPIYESADDLAASGSTLPTEDSVNLRCFHQKQRFGVDYLYPVERYSRALSSLELCPASPSLDPTECDPEDVIQNPLFAARTPADVIFAGIVGAPWQDLAVDPTGATPLSYRPASSSNPEGLEWSWLIGERHPEDGLFAPEDPWLLETVERRDGSQPSTGATLAEEWQILDRDDLQYACTFALTEPLVCPSIDNVPTGATGSCACTYYGDPAYENPLCRTPEGDYGQTQHRAGAHPATRQLQVLYDLSEQAVVASICPKETVDTAAPDYGYRPATTAILAKLGSPRP